MDQINRSSQLDLGIPKPAEYRPGRQIVHDDEPAVANVPD
jgi:hypothetical protein